MIKLLSGNKAAANAVRLARPDVCATYPITPQTPLVEELEKMYANGLLGDCEMVETDGEHSSMSIVTAASVAGGRVFTATSSWGLAYMFEPMMYAAGMRVPIVMVDVCRETPAMRGVSAGRQDIMSSRDTGWITIECETCQEILDTVLMAYRLAEHSEVLLPVVVAYDGYYLSHLSESVDVPEQTDVNRFLPPITESKRTTLQPGQALAFGQSFSERLYCEYRYKNLKAMERVHDVFPTVEKEFEAVFGRSYNGMVDTYRTDDAEMVLVTAGSVSGTAREMIDRERDKGHRVGLARIRMFRPFPRKELAKVLDGRKLVCFLESSIAMGWDAGHLFVESRAVLPYMKSQPKMIDFIDGMSNVDVTFDKFEKLFDIAYRAMNGETVPETTWLMFEN